MPWPIRPSSTGNPNNSQPSTLNPRLTLATDLLNRYTWLIDTIRRHGRITRRQLNECWERSPFSRGRSELPRRTLYNYRQAIAEIFGINICMDASRYEYYIEESSNALGEITEWLLDSSATSSALHSSLDVASRIMLENVPSARENLNPIIEAIRYNHPLRFDYSPYTRVNSTMGVEVEPYFLRIFRQLWYVTGRCRADDKVKTYSLDRMHGLQLLPDTFTPPEYGTEPKEYFKDAFGIMVTQGKPREVRLKVDSRQAKYFRALPLHASQQEEVGDGYSVFVYKLLLTSDFLAEILSHGSSVEVLAPRELRTMVISSLRDTLNLYERPFTPQ